MSSLLQSLLSPCRAREISSIAAKVDHLWRLYPHKWGNFTAFDSEQPVLGFGMSRLAAQQLGQDWGQRIEVVMCDVNVADLNKLESGYDSDREEKVRTAVRSTTLYMSAGEGAGTPSRTWDDGSLEKKQSAEGGKGRPLEQVVTVGDELLYDPCFITSSEDGDMTEGFLDEENRMRQRGTVGSSSFRGSRRIEKVDLGTEFLADAYGKARDAYLKSLGWEDRVLIVYRQDKKERTVTVGALAAEFAQAYGLNADHIRSLIIEKILLQHKWS